MALLCAIAASASAQTLPLQILPPAVLLENQVFGALEKPPDLQTLPSIKAGELLKARGGPLRVTLRARNALLPQVLEQVSQQTGYPMTLNRRDVALTKVGVSVDLRAVSFWRAMHEILAPIPARFDAAGDANALFVAPGRPLFAGRSVESGPLTLSVPYIGRTTGLRFDSAQSVRQTTLDLSLEVGFDPRLLAESGQAHCRIVEARDDTGAKLRLAQSNEVSALYLARNNALFRLPLQGLGAKSRKLSLLRGVISFAVWSGFDQTMIPLDAPQKVTVGPQTLTLLRAANAGKNQYGREEWRVNIYNQGNTPFYSAPYTIALIDAQGAELFQVGMGGSPQISSIKQGKGSGAFYSFETNGSEPRTVAVRVRHSLRRVEVPWEMRDLPLP